MVHQNKPYGSVGLIFFVSRSGKAGVCAPSGTRTAAQATAACGGNREPEQGQRSQRARPAQGAPPDAGTATRTVPAVLRPGRQKRPCGAFLERGRVPGGLSRQQHATGVESCGKRRAVFVCDIPGRYEHRVHHRGREQLRRRPPPAAETGSRSRGSGRQRRAGREPRSLRREPQLARRRRSAGTNSPADCWLARGRVPGEAPGQQHAAGVEPCGNAGLFLFAAVGGSRSSATKPPTTTTTC